jgi:hypothetical protein
VDKNANSYLPVLTGPGKRPEYPFPDSDHEIETRGGVGISAIFESEGESGSRRRETRDIGKPAPATGVACWMQKIARYRARGLECV